MERGLKKSILSWCLTAFAPALALAQNDNFDRYRPKVPPSDPTLPTIPSTPVPAAQGSDDILVDRIDAIVVLDHADKVQMHAPLAEQQGVAFDFADQRSFIYSAASRQLLDAAIGQPLTLRRLNQLSRDLIDLSKKCGYPVIDIQIPEQNVSEGTLQIVVVEPRIGSITASGACNTDVAWLLSRAECSKPGYKIYEPSLEEDLYWLNRSPFRKVELDLAPGSINRTTDIRYKITEVPARRGYVGYEDTGVRSLALERLLAGVSLGNIFGRDGTLGYQYTADPSFELLQAHATSFAYEFDKTWAGQVFGSWSAAKPDLPPPFNQSGESWQTGATLLRYRSRSSMHEEFFSFGCDFKSTNNSLEFSGVNVQNSQAELFQLRTGYTFFERFENLDYFRETHDLVVGPGDGFSPGNTREAFSSLRADTSPTYWYYRGGLDTRRELPRNWELGARGAWQATSERLLFSETLGFGGFDTIRGYDQRLVNGDCGWIMNWEFGPQPYRAGIGSANPRALKLVSFVDMGQAFNLHPVNGEFADEFLAGVGCGLRYTVASRTSLRLDYAHALSDVPGQVTRDRIHVNFVTFFGRLP